MSGGGNGVSIVTQTCVRPESADAFARWQGETSTLITSFPGFLEQRLMPPNPPLQVDWVILQRFASLDDARRWLASPERQKRIEGVAAMLIGRDDVHIVQNDNASARGGAVATVISTRVRPGKEVEYRAWEHRIAAAQSKARGLQGYRFEPAIPGVQDDYIAILRFDNEANLQAWLESPERRKLIEEAAPLTEEFHTRTLRSGFEQWFSRDGSSQDATPLPVWKMDMLVLLLLYTIVFLWGVFVGTPFLDKTFGMSFAIALFIGNIVSVALTGVLVPWTAGYFGWWLRPATGESRWRVHLLGAVIILAIYAVMVVAFWKLF